MKKFTRYERTTGISMERTALYRKYCAKYPKYRVYVSICHDGLYTITMRKYSFLEKVKMAMGIAI